MDERKVENRAVFCWTRNRKSFIKRVNRKKFLIERQNSICQGLNFLASAVRATSATLIMLYIKPCSTFILKIRFEEQGDDAQKKKQSGEACSKKNFQLEQVNFHRYTKYRSFQRAFAPSCFHSCSLSSPPGKQVQDPGAYNFDAK